MNLQSKKFKIGQFLHEVKRRLIGENISKFQWDTIPVLRQRTQIFFLFWDLKIPKKLDTRHPGFFVWIQVLNGSYDSYYNCIRSVVRK